MLNRLAKLEPRTVLTFVPNVISVRHGETADDALARFRADYGANIVGYHGVIVVPAHIDSPQAEAEFATRFYENQNQLVANANPGNR